MDRLRMADVRGDQQDRSKYVRVADVSEKSPHRLVSRHRNDERWNRPMEARIRPADPRSGNAGRRRSHDLFLRRPIREKGELPMQKHALTLTTALCVGLAIGCGGSKSTGPSNITYVANLAASNEVLANGNSAGVVSSGTGTWTGVLNPTTNVLTWTMTFSGLTSNSSL